MRLVSAMAAVVLTACATAAPQSAELAEIQFVLFGDATETAGYQRMIDEFHETTPGVRVTMSPVAKQDDLLAKLTTGFAGGSPPDVFLINYRKYGQFAAQGVLAPVQPYLDASDNLDEGCLLYTSDAADE